MNDANTQPTTSEQFTVMFIDSCSFLQRSCKGTSDSSALNPILSLSPSIERRYGVRVTGPSLQAKFETQSHVLAVGKAMY